MIFLNSEKRKKWIGLLSFSIAFVGIAWFLYHDDFANAWVLLLGAAYLYLDRFHEDNKKGDSND